MLVWSKHRKRRIGDEALRWLLRVDVQRVGVPPRARQRDGVVSARRAIAGQRWIRYLADCRSVAECGDTTTDATGLTPVGVVSEELQPAAESANPSAANPRRVFERIISLTGLFTPSGRAPAPAERGKPEHGSHSAPRVDCLVGKGATSPGAGSSGERSPSTCQRPVLGLRPARTTKGHQTRCRRSSPPHIVRNSFSSSEVGSYPCLSMNRPAADQLLV
jgi:hypothetical protein